MKIGLRGGHSRNCMGAIGLRNEYTCMQELYKACRDEFISRGHNVIDCNSNANRSNAELQEGVNKANSNDVDLFISLHMNAFNGTANGTEVLVAPGSSVKDKAQAILNNLCKFGWFNRGVKEQGNLYEMRSVKAPNILIEVCFCDSKKDIDIFSPISYKDMANAIVDGATGEVQVKGIPNSLLKATHYALEDCIVVEAITGKYVGMIYKNEEFKVNWTGGKEDNWIKSVDFSGGNGYIKSGMLDNKYKICKIGEKPEEIPTDPKPPVEETPKTYDVVIRCKDKTEAELIKTFLSTAKIEEK